MRGALEAAKEFGVQIVLVGRGADILASMKAQGWDTLPDGVELANAEDVVDMHCDPAAVVKQHPNSSLVLGAGMLAQGGGDAFISAGNTGALLTAATLLVKRIRGIRRAAFSPVLPTKDGHAILIDAGANAECTPEFLLQFGCMGSFYAQKALGIESPRVGLLNNGAEDTKGDPLHREAHQLLKRAGEQGTIHFVGNVEARDVPFGAADVIVADGFSGNVLLKTMEGTAMFMSGMMKQMFYRNPLTMLGALLCEKGPERHPQDHGLPRNGRVHRHRHQPPGHQGARLVRRRRHPRRDPAGHPRGRERLLRGNSCQYRADDPAQGGRTC